MKMKKFKKYLSIEIGIEFKAFLYFYCIVLFYCIYELIGGSLDANIIFLAEMIAATYVMGYVQVYFMRNFDESDHFGIYEASASFFCSLLYAVTSYLFGWYDKKIEVTFIFIGYMFLCFVCAFLIYKIKRDIDTKQLNEELKEFKKNKENRLEK